MKQDFRNNKNLLEVLKYGLKKRNASAWYVWRQLLEEINISSCSYFNKFFLE